MPFYSVAFHLLSQGQLDEALDIVNQTEITPPVGMDEMDIELYTRRIRAVCACLLIGRKWFKKYYFSASFIQKKTI